MLRTRFFPYLALALMACGGGDSETADAVEVSSGGEHGVVEVAPPPADPFAYLPATAFGVGIARVDTLRQSPYWAPLADMLRQGAPVGGGFEEAALGFLDRTERVAFCTYTRRERADLAWIFIQGDFRDGELPALLEQAIPEVGERPFVEGTLAGYRAFTQRDAVVVELDSGSYLFGPTRVVTSELLERARSGHRHALLSDPRYTAMAQRVGLDNAGFAYVGVATDTARAALDREVDDFGAPHGAVEAVGVRIDASSGIAFDAFAVTTDATVAQNIVQRLQAEKAQAAGSMAVRATGMGGVVESVVVEAAGSDVVVAARVDDATVQSLFTRFRSVAVLGMRAMAAEREAREARRQQVPPDPGTTTPQ